MKIIAHTAYGYLAELSPQELAAITGNHADDRHASNRYGSGNACYSHAIGTELKPSETWKHLQSILNNEGHRKNIAESLRAAATLIEHTPSPITIPEPDSKPATA